MNDPIIKFENVSFYYDAEGEKPKKAIDEVSLAVNRGEFLCILGHNGSGKSTLAKLTNAIFVPQKGRVLVEGMDTADESRTNNIRQTVGMVFQNPDNQIVATIVEDDVAFGPENLGVEPAEIRERVDKALQDVGMYEFRQHEPHNLSGGQKQRIAIAGVLAMQTKCMVLDEPTAMLDPVGRVEVLKTVMRLNRELGITVVYITHFMDEAVKADRVVVMDDGKIILDNEPRQVFSDIEKIKSVGLDVPQATELSYRLKKMGLDLPQGILDEDECARAIIKVAEEMK